MPHIRLLHRLLHPLLHCPLSRIGVSTILAIYHLQDGYKPEFTAKVISAARVFVMHRRDFRAVPNEDWTSVKRGWSRRRASRSDHVAGGSPMDTAATPPITHTPYTPPPCAQPTPFTHPVHPAYPPPLPPSQAPTDGSRLGRARSSTARARRDCAGAATARHRAIARRVPMRGRRVPRRARASLSGRIAAHWARSPSARGSRVCAQRPIASSRDGGGLLTKRYASEPEPDLDFGHVSAGELVPVKL